MRRRSAHAPEVDSMGFNSLKWWSRLPVFQASRSPRAQQTDGSRCRRALKCYRRARSPTSSEQVVAAAPSSAASSQTVDPLMWRRTAGILDPERSSNSAPCLVRSPAQFPGHPTDVGRSSQGGPWNPVRGYGSAPGKARGYDKMLRQSCRAAAAILQTPMLAPRCSR